MNQFFDSNSLLHSAVIVEMRPHTALPFVLEKTLIRGRPRNLIFYHGTRNGPFVKKVLTDLLGQDWETTMPVKLFEVPIINVNAASYNALLKSVRFWENIPGENILIFQTDSVILQEKADWAAFEQYDYVGAPLYFNNKVGNGGFSWRKKTPSIQTILHTKNLGNPHNEDVFFAYNMVHLGYKVPSYSIGMSFSVETVWDGKTIPLGVHNAWHYKDRHGPAKWKKLTELLPEILVLEQLQYDWAKIKNNYDLPQASHLVYGPPRSYYQARVPLKRSQTAPTKSIQHLVTAPLKVISTNKVNAIRNRNKSLS